MRDVILDTVGDLVVAFLDDDRKGDEELPRGAIESAIESREVSIDEIAALFKAKLISALESQ